MVAGNDHYGKMRYVTSNILNRIKTFKGRSHLIVNFRLCEDRYNALAYGYDCPPLATYGIERGTTVGIVVGESFFHIYSSTVPSKPLAGKHRGEQREEGKPR